MENAVLTLKDWLTLLIPIICNGIILAYFNKRIDRKISKLSKVDENEAATIVEFVKQIDEANQIFNHLQIIWTNNNSGYNYEETLKHYSSCIQTLYNSSINYIFLNKFTSRIIKLQKHSENLVNFINLAISKNVKNSNYIYHKHIRRIKTDFRKLYRIKSF